MSKKVIAIVAIPVFALVLSGCSFYKFGKNQGNDFGQKNGKMPAEMTAACQGKGEGDSCEVSMPAPPSKDGSANSSDNAGKKMTGTCKKSQDSQLICMGSGGGPGGPSGQSPEQPKPETAK